jgi:pimeloyl-ACP methyl ester carboxylesterase
MSGHRLDLHRAADRFCYADAAHLGSANVESASVGMIPKSVFWLESRIPLNAMPPWITQTDIDFYSNEFKRSGFRGGLNWYRNIDRNWELLAPWAGAKVIVPALYVAADRDLVVRFPGADKLIANLGQFVPQLREKILLPDCGHWTQQERPEEINAALIRFLKELN